MPGPVVLKRNRFVETNLWRSRRRGGGGCVKVDLSPWLQIIPNSESFQPIAGIHEDLEKNCVSWAYSSPLPGYLHFVSSCLLGVKCNLSGE